MDDNRLRTLISILTFLVLVVMAFYLYRNIENIKKDPCDACEKGTGFKCTNWGNSIVYNKNGSVYRSKSQPNAGILSNSTLISIYDINK